MSMLRSTPPTAPGGPSSLPRTLQPPPEVPDLGPSQGTLTTYLRNFALWCRHGFADKISGTTAQPGIMIQATDASTGAVTAFSYLVGVKVNVSAGTPSSPQITLTLVPLGSGKP